MKKSDILTRLALANRFDEISKRSLCNIEVTRAIGEVKLAIARGHR